MKHIVSFSGGKDSTAMLLRMIELGMPIDSIVCVHCSSWEFPQMIDHILKVKAYINRIIDVRKPSTEFDVLIKKYGIPNMKYRWCTGYKSNALYKGLKKTETIVYTGYAYDEKKRFKSLSMRGYKQIAPLIDWQWTEKDCLEYCYSKGFTWHGLYEKFDRVSCWCCPFKNSKELKNLEKYYPDLWQKRKEMYKKYAWNTTTQR